MGRETQTEGRRVKGADARSLKMEGRRPVRADVGLTSAELRVASTRRGEILQDSQGYRRETLTTQVFTRGLTGVVAQSDAQTFTGPAPTGVVAQSDAQAFYT